MSDGFERRDILRAIEEIEMHGPSRDEMKIRVPNDTWGDMREEAGLVPSHPGEEWAESHESAFWDAWVQA